MAIPVYQFLSSARGPFFAASKKFWGRDFTTTLTQSSRWGVSNKDGPLVSFVLLRGGRAEKKFSSHRPFFWPLKNAARATLILSNAQIARSFSLAQAYPEVGLWGGQKSNSDALTFIVTTCSSLWKPESDTEWFEKIVDIQMHKKEVSLEVRPRSKYCDNQPQQQVCENHKEELLWQPLFEVEAAASIYVGKDLKTCAKDVSLCERGSQCQYRGRQRPPSGSASINSRGRWGREAVIHGWNPAFCSARSLPVFPPELRCLRLKACKNEKLPRNVTVSFTLLWRKKRRTTEWWLLNFHRSGLSETPRESWKSRASFPGNYLYDDCKTWWLSNHQRQIEGVLCKQPRGGKPVASTLARATWIILEKCEAASGDARGVLPDSMPSSTPSENSLGEVGNNGGGGSQNIAAKISRQAPVTISITTSEEIEDPEPATAAASIKTVHGVLTNAPPSVAGRGANNSADAEAETASTAAVVVVERSSAASSNCEAAIANTNSNSHSNNGGGDPTCALNEAATTTASTTRSSCFNNRSSKPQRVISAEAARSDSRVSHTFGQGRGQDLDHDQIPPDANYNRNQFETDHRRGRTYLEDSLDFVNLAAHLKAASLQLVSREAAEATLSLVKHQQTSVDLDTTRQSNLEAKYRRYKSWDPPCCPEAAPTDFCCDSGRGGAGGYYCCVGGEFCDLDQKRPPPLRPTTSQQHQSSRCKVIFQYGNHRSSSTSRRSYEQRTSYEAGGGGLSPTVPTSSSTGNRDRVDHIQATLSLDRKKLHRNKKSSQFQCIGCGALVRKQPRNLKSSSSCKKVEPSATISSTTSPILSDCPTKNNRQGHEKKDFLVVVDWKCFPNHYHN